MLIRYLKSIIVFCGILVLTNITNAYYSPGQPTGFVNDFSGVLNSEQKQQLETKLSQFEKETSNEITVAIINDLQNDTIENFAVELFKGWGIGKEGRDNGVLILIAKDNRELRIEVGYGLEGALTDAQSSWIINQKMKPAFQKNDFYNGINEAIDKIILATKGEYIPSQESNNSNFNWDIVIGFGFFGFMWLSAILGRSKSWWLGGLLGGIAGVILGILKGFIYFGIISIAILLPIGLLFDYIVSKQYKSGKMRGSIPWWIGGGGWGGGKSGGFGGFGGGMSGGGGSSGRW